MNQSELVCFHCKQLHHSSTFKQSHGNNKNNGDNQDGVNDNTEKIRKVVVLKIILFIKEEISGKLNLQVVRKEQRFIQTFEYKNTELYLMLY